MSDSRTHGDHPAVDDEEPLPEPYRATPMCHNCLFFFAWDNRCRRYPEFIEKLQGDWCGEWKEKQK